VIQVDRQLGRCLRVRIEDRALRPALMAGSRGTCEGTRAADL